MLDLRKVNHHLKSKISDFLKKHTRIKTSELDHLIHAMHLSGELSKLTPQQIDNIIYAIQSNGHLIYKFSQLDHIIHALHQSGELSKLTSQQIDNIIYAMQSAGHLSHLKDISKASYNDGHLISFHNADFVNNPLFAESYEIGKATNSWLGYDIPWRVYVICWGCCTS